MPLLKSINFFGLYNIFHDKLNMLQLNKFGLYLPLIDFLKIAFLLLQILHILHYPSAWNHKWKSLFKMLDIVPDFQLKLLIVKKLIFLERSLKQVCSKLKNNIYMVITLTAYRYVYPCFCIIKGNNSRIRHVDGSSVIRWPYRRNRRVWLWKVPVDVKQLFHIFRKAWTVPNKHS